MIEPLVVSPVVVSAVMAIIAALVVYIIYRLFLTAKRPMRKAELRHLIGNLRDPNGASNALELLELCLHISQHYGIPLEEMDFEDYHDLAREATQSLLRAQKREQRQLQEIKKNPSSFPNILPVRL